MPPQKLLYPPKKQSSGYIRPCSCAVFLAAKSTAGSIASLWGGAPAQRDLEHLYATACDFVHVLVHFRSWLPEQQNIK